MSWTIRKSEQFWNEKKGKKSEFKEVEIQGRGLAELSRVKRFTTLREKKEGKQNKDTNRNEKEDERNLLKQKDKEKMDKQNRTNGLEETIMTEKFTKDFKETL